MKVMNVHPYSEEGIPEAGMGVDAADYNGDGLLDIFITHLDFELNRLYQNKGAMSFSDVTMLSAECRTGTGAALGGRGKHCIWSAVDDAGCWIPALLRGSHN